MTVLRNMYPHADAEALQPKSCVSTRWHQDPTGGSFSVMKLGCSGSVCLLICARRDRFCLVPQPDCMFPIDKTWINMPSPSGMKPAFPASTLPAKQPSRWAVSFPPGCGSDMGS